MCTWLLLNMCNLWLTWRPNLSLNADVFWDAIYLYKSLIGQIHLPTPIFLCWNLFDRKKFSKRSEVTKNIFSFIWRISHIYIEYLHLFLPIRRNFWHYHFKHDLNLLFYNIYNPQKNKAWKIDIDWWRK